MINSLEKLEIVKVRGEAAQILGGLAVAATGGEMRSNYFQNTAPKNCPFKRDSFLVIRYN